MSSWSPRGSARRAPQRPARALAAIAVGLLTASVIGCTGTPTPSSAPPATSTPGWASASSAAATIPQYTRLGLITDFGTCDPGERWAADAINSWSVSAIVTAGDNSQGATACAPFEDSVWSFFERDPDGRGDPPVWPTLGNHDYSDAGAGLAAYQRAFPYLTKDADPQQRWYTQSLGNVNIFVLDSEVTGTELEAQRVWLKGALRAAKSASPHAWNVVLLHRPPYTSGVHEPNSSMRSGAGWRYAAWGADLTISGHEHLWEDVVVDGFHHVTAGLGARENARDCPEERAPGSRVCLAGLGVARIEATENTFELSYYQPGADSRPVLRDTVRLGRPPQRAS